MGKEKIWKFIKRPPKGFDYIVVLNTFSNSSGLRLFLSKGITQKFVSISRFSCSAMKCTDKNERKSMYNFIKYSRSSIDLKKEVL